MESGSLTDPIVNKHEISPDRYDIILRDPMDCSIVDKVLSHPEFVKINNLVCKPYGLRTNYFTDPQYAQFQVVEHTPGETIMCIGLVCKKSVFRPVRISNISRNISTIDQWKVITAKAGGSGKGGDGTPKIFILQPNEVCTETYLVLGTFRSELEAANFRDAMSGAFMQFMICTRKVTHDIIGALKWVPALDWTRTWSDVEIFDRFGLTQDERDHIMKKMEKVMKRHQGYTARPQVGLG